MDTEEIRNMLERFYECKTTPEEEKALKHFFQFNDVPEALETDRKLFSELFADDVEAPDYLEQRLSRNIDNWNTIEKGSTRKVRMIALKWVTGAAASFLLLLSLTTYLNQKHGDIVPFAEMNKETYDNPNDAAGETERALSKFSEALNKGLDKINFNDTNAQQ